MPAFSGMRGLKNNILKKNYLEVKQQLANSGSSLANPTSLRFGTSYNTTWTFPRSVPTGQSDSFLTGGMFGIVMGNNELTAYMSGRSSSITQMLYSDTRATNTTPWTLDGTLVSRLKSTSTSQVLGIAISRDGEIMVHTYGLTSGQSFNIRYTSNTDETGVSVPSSSGNGSVAISQDGTTCVHSGGTSITLTTGLRTGTFTYTTLFTNTNYTRCWGIAVCNINKVVIASCDSGNSIDNGRIAIISYEPSISVSTATVLKSSSNSTIIPSSIDFLWFSTNAPPSFVLVRTNNMAFIYRWNSTTKRIVLDNSGNAIPIASTTLIFNSYSTTLSSINNTYIQDKNEFNFITKLRALNIVNTTSTELKKYNSLDIIPTW